MDFWERTLLLMMVNFLAQFIVSFIVILAKMKNSNTLAMLGVAFFQSVANCIIIASVTTVIFGANILGIWYCLAIMLLNIWFFIETPKLSEFKALSIVHTMIYLLNMIYYFLCYDLIF